MHQNHEQQILSFIIDIPKQIIILFMQEVNITVKKPQQSLPLKKNHPKEKESASDRVQDSKNTLHGLAKTSEPSVSIELYLKQIFEKSKKKVSISQKNCEVEQILEMDDEQFISQYQNDPFFKMKVDSRMSRPRRKSALVTQQTINLNDIDNQITPQPTLLNSIKASKSPGQQLSQRYRQLIEPRISIKKYS